MLDHLHWVTWYTYELAENHKETFGPDGPHELATRAVVVVEYHKNQEGQEKH
ncbi:hypothetical protein Tco_0078614, partial [Tanacetum coccineum]